MNASCWDISTASCVWVSVSESRCISPTARRCRRRLAELQVNLERIAAGLDDMVPPTIPVLPLNSRAPLSRASSADVPGGRRNRRIRQWAPVGAAACIALVSAILSLTHHEQAPAAATYDEAELLAVYDDYQSPNDIWAGARTGHIDSR